MDVNLKSGTPQYQQELKEVEVNSERNNLNGGQA